MKEKETLNDYLEMLMDTPFQGQVLYIYDECGNVLFAETCGERLYMACSTFLLKQFIIKKKSKQGKKHTLIVECVGF